MMKRIIQFDSEILGKMCLADYDYSLLTS